MLKQISSLVIIILLLVAACQSAPVTRPPRDNNGTVGDVVNEKPTTNAAFASPVPTQIPPTVTPVPTLVPTLEPTATPDLVGQTAPYENVALGLEFNYPIEWVVDNANESTLAVGPLSAVQTALVSPNSQVTEVLIQISAEQSGGRKPLSLLADKVPMSSPNFTVFPEPIVVNEYEGAHSVRELTNAETGSTRVIETYVLTNQDDVYFFNIEMTLLAVIDNQPKVDGLINSVRLAGFDREAIGSSLTDDQGFFDGGELFIDSVVTGTIDAGVNYVVGLGGQGQYLFATVAESADIVMTIASASNPENVLVTVDNSFSAEPEATIWSPPQDGGYIVSLRDYSFTGGEYAFAIYQADTEVGVSPLVEPRKNLRPLIYLEPDNNSDISVKLLNEAQIPILFVDNEGIGGAEVAIPVGLDEITYTLDIESSTGAIDSVRSTVVYVKDYFEVPSLSRNFGVSTPLATNMITTGLTGFDSHYITVESNRPHVLIANANRDADLVIRVKDLNGVEQLVIDEYATGEIESRVVALPIGNYILEVEDWRGSRYEYAAGLYEFFPSANDMVEFELGPELDAVVIAQPSDNFDVVLIAEDLNYNQIANRDGGFNGAPEIVVFQAGRTVPKGVYTATGSGFEGTNGSFQIGVIQVGRDFVDIGNR